MMLRHPDLIALYVEGGEISAHGSRAVLNDASAWTEMGEGELLLKVTAASSAPRYVRLRWNFAGDEAPQDDVKIFGDVWERSYADMEWRGIVPQRCMPWVCAASNGSDGKGDVSGRRTDCYGVKTRASALCFWQYDPRGVTLWADVRNGGSGVRLNGRELTACHIVFESYRDMSAFDALYAFYKGLNDVVLTPDHKVYGSNNWYYAYGNSSHEDILGDSRLLSELCHGLENRPYMVIDDGWQPNRCDAPWNRGNERFPDMKRLCGEMKALGVRPGIWIRYLNDTARGTEGVLPEHRLMRDDKYLDPSHPDVLARVARDTKRIVEDWGYQLIKHDFSTFDMFGRWGVNCPTNLTDDGWHFWDRTKTSAEIVVNFYRTIHEAAGENTVIIGCNVIGHLTAGLAHLNRTGDDTSGREWDRTRKYGVNALAFHMLQDKTFFAADADCVGIMGTFPWALNRRWLRALSVSGTPLFVSCKPGVLNADELKELSEAYARASVQTDVFKPLDWMENSCPERWLLNGEETRFDWYPETGAESFKP
ncbi:MAG: alpha-galactosidase [Clostridiales bacterium]|nr:alpha-galactosidase [Clostridiales bacterium]